MHGIYAAICNGIRDQGEGGIVYVKGDECTYMMPCALPSADVRAGVSSFIANDVEKRFFFAVREEAGELQVFTVARAAVEESVREELTARGC